MKCPHCGIVFHTDQDTWGDDYFTIQNSAGTDLLVSGTTCPACKEPVVILADEIILTEESTSEKKIIYPPDSRPPNVSDAVPPELKADYVEAYMVLPVSSKASATLSRRVLQTMLTKQGYCMRNLYDQIQAVVAEKDLEKVLPSQLRDVVDAVRSFGNFSTHPMNDVTTLQIIEVQPEEAAWCLEIIEALFDHYYVRPAADAERLANLDQKRKRATT